MNAYIRFVTSGLLILLCSAPAFAQTPTKKYPVKDSVNLKEKDRIRQWSYEQGMASFAPAKKDRGSIGIFKGYSFLSSDVRSELGLGIGLNYRKAIGHVLSIRTAASLGYARGLNWRPNGGFLRNEGLNGTTNASADYVTNAPYEFVFYNYRMRYFDINVQAVATLNNINFYKKDPKVALLGFIGPGLMFYETKIDAVDEDNNIYDYSGVPIDADRAIRQDALNTLRNLYDGDYETSAETEYTRATLGNLNVLPTVVFGLGLTYKMSERVDIALEHRVTWSTSDLLDGQRWEETNTLTANADLHQFSSIGFNFRLGKAEESKWWSNPLVSPYDDIRTLKKVKDKETKDSDGDGVVDSKDKEKNTPEDVVVDQFGRALDSDGDGIQDFRDSEPFSPKGAQVDKKGKALDSDMDGVADIHDLEKDTPEGSSVDVKGRKIEGGGAAVMGDEDVDLLLPMVNFDLGSATIKQEFFPSLYYIARLMTTHTEVKLKVTGHADVRNSNQGNSELSKKRSEAVVNFLTSNFGIAKDRFVIDFMSSDNPLVPNLPSTKDPKSEGFHYLNRRVEFEIIR